MKKHKPIKIAGAGIAGLTAAIILKQAGYEVMVYERNNDIGGRFNDDFQGLMNWGFEEDILDFMKTIGLHTGFWRKPIDSLDMHCPGRKMLPLKTPAPYVYLIKRGSAENSFDRSLYGQAKSAGIRVKFGSPLNPDQSDIIATGPDAGRKPAAMALGYTFETDAPDHAAVFVGKEFAHKGYSYFFVVNGKATIATCVFGRFDKMNQYLDNTYNHAKEYYGLTARRKKKFAGFGNFNPMPCRSIVAGEAGGFQDFLWMFGVRYAMITGHLAAHSIISGQDYNALCGREVGPKLKTSMVNRMWYGSLNNFGYWQLAKILYNSPDVVSLLTKVYNPNIFSKILYPVSRILLRK